VRDHVGIEDCASSGYLGQRFDEPVDVDDSVLEQVAEAFGVLPGEFGRVTTFQRL